MILITGVTGRIGSAAARALASRQSISVRAIARNPAAMSDTLSSVECVAADLANRDSLDSALQGVTSALLVAPNGRQQFGLEKNFIDAAVAAGVEHVVKISSMEAGPHAKAPIPKLHYQAEQYLQSSGLRWTMLRPNFFLQNFLMYAQAIKEHSLFSLPFADAKIAPVDTSDVGSVAATVLGDSTHINKCYTLASPELSTLHDIADVFSKVCKRPIRYVDQDPSEFRAFMQKIVPSGWLANAVSDLFEEISNGTLAETSNDINTILGRAPITTTQFIERHRGAFC